jgi:hypothetical protein
VLTAGSLGGLNGKVIKTAWPADFIFDSDVAVKPKQFIPFQIKS